MAMKSVNLGTAVRAVDLLTTGYGVDQTYYDRLVKDPAYRRQVGLAMTGQLAVTEITRGEWVERELLCLSQLSTLGLEMIPCRSLGTYDFTEKGSLEDYINKAYQPGFGSNHRFVPGGLTRQALLRAASLGGMQTGTDYPSGEQLPTEAGIFDCDLATVMQPMDSDQRPFMLDHNEHEAWSKDQGGSGLSSAEEAQYLILRMKLEFGRVLFMGGWIRCRNAAGSGESVGVVFGAGSGLSVNYGSRSYRRWFDGCVPRKFTALGA